MAATEATNPGSYAGMEGAHLSCEDMEFQAEWELITVIPNFRGGKLAMISGEFGPFIPNVPVSVPLFIAMNLKDSRKARVRAPAWLNSGNLNEVLDREREMTDQASDLAEVGMPFHYNTIAYKLLEQAKDDIEAEATGEVHTCRKLLRDIEDVRMSKIRKGTRMVMDEVKKKDHVHDVSSLINFRNLTFTELNNNRPPLKKALDTLADINPRAVAEDGGYALGGGAAAEADEEQKPADDAPRRKLRRYR